MLAQNRNLLSLLAAIMGSAPKLAQTISHRSRVLDAMGLTKLSSYSIRVSAGWATTPADWDRFADVYEMALSRHVARSAVEVF